MPGRSSRYHKPQLFQPSTGHGKRYGCLRSSPGCLPHIPVYRCPTSLHTDKTEPPSCFAITDCPITAVTCNPFEFGSHRRSSFRYAQLKSIIAVIMRCKSDILLRAVICSHRIRIGTIISVLSDQTGLVGIPGLPVGLALSIDDTPQITAQRIIPGNVMTSRFPHFSIELIL